MIDILSLLVTILLFALIAYLIMWALGQIPLPQPIRTMVIVVLVLVFIVYLVQRFGLL